MNDEPDYFHTAPKSFALCLSADCPAASTCLRALAAAQADASCNTLLVINPRVADPSGPPACTWYRKAESTLLAYGFRRALAQVPSGRMRTVRAAIRGLSSQCIYYYMLEGKKAISPSMQKRIAAILVRNGVTEPVEFDRYESRIIW